MGEVVDYRMDAYEKRADVADARMQRVEALLTDIRLEIANLRGEVRQKPSSATIWGILATMAFIAFAIVSMFVGVLTYLQAFHSPH